MSSALAAADLGPVRAEFPGYVIWEEVTADRVRYVARSQTLACRPHAVVTADIDELRRALAASPAPGDRREPPATTVRTNGTLIAEPPSAAVAQRGAGEVSTAHSRRRQLAAARDLLVRTAELPDGERALLDVLGEYRWMVFHLASELDKRTAA